MTKPIFLWSVSLALVLVAGGGLLWYVLAPPALAPEKVNERAEPGIIEGTTYYPSEFNPAQRVCAESVTDPSYVRCADVPEQVDANVPSFSIKVTPGTYHVYAFLRNPSDLGLDESVRAYWTEFVTCGLNNNCPSHTKLDVVVTSGQTVVDIKPYDWYSR